MERYTVIESNILEKNLSTGAFSLYFILSSFCFGNKSYCFPSQKILASKLNKSVKSVQRYTKELKKCGLIEVTHTKNGCNIYKVFHSNAKFYKNNSSIFCSFPQRDYDFDELERQLLNASKNR